MADGSSGVCKLGCRRMANCVACSLRIASTILVYFGLSFAIPFADAGVNSARLPAGPVGVEGSGESGSKEGEGSSGSDNSTDGPEAEAGDGSLGLDWTQEDSRHEGGGGDGSGGNDEAGSGSDETASGSNEVPGSAVSTPQIYDILRRAGEQPRINCTGEDVTHCRADRSVCSAPIDYSVVGGEVLATPRSSRPREAGSVTMESVTINVANGSESSNGFSCQQPPQPVMQVRMDGEPVEGGAEGAPEPVVIVVTRSDFAKLPVEPSVASAGPERGWLPDRKSTRLNSSH